MARPWVFGNTTVRTALRLKDGLAALATSGYIGIVEGKNESKFARALHAAGVVELSESTKDVSSIARKWRGAMTKLGFLIPKVTPVSGVQQSQIGAKFTITPNGQRLLEANTTPAIQEVFLRAISAIQVPSPTDRNFEVAAFSPLRHTLAIMLRLERLTGSPHLDFIEMATVVQLSSPEHGLAEIADAVLSLRVQREGALNKKKFDRECLKACASEHGLKWGTYFDYADLNFRYLKATGVVQNKGRGISIVPEHRVLVERIAAQPELSLTPAEYFLRLFNGAALPTDEQSAALVVLESLQEIASSRGVGIDLSQRNLDTPSDISIVRFELEELIFHSKEEDYASEQATRIDEILAVMTLINERKGSLKLGNGQEVSVPTNEMPAYFEWVLWRAFLAIRHHVTKPHEIRRFKIDQDFLPIGTAAGGGADVVVEFEDYVVAVEVTLTESSRQEAAEGEPVRRHVADLVKKYEIPGKAVYGLFIAKRIDSNTAETFRIGVWYRSDDSKLIVDIVPLTLGQFRTFIKEMFDSGSVHPNKLRELLDDITQLRNESDGAPEWKQRISESISG